MAKKNNQNTERIALNIIATIAFIGLIFEFSLLISRIFRYRVGETLENLLGLPTNEYSFLMFLGIFTMATMALHWGKLTRKLRQL